MQKKTLQQLAELVGAKIQGDPDIVISAAATIENASKGNITFLSNPKYFNQLTTTNASAVVVSQNLETSADAILICDDPYYAFRQIVVLLHGHRKHKKISVSPKASIDPSAHIGKNCNIYNNVTVSENAKVGDNCVLYPGVFIGPETVIGDDCILYPNAVVYDNCIVGNRVILQANVTVGEDGFGFATHNGQHHKIPHIGRLILEDDVEIGSGASIERGAFSDTVIGQGSKIGDMVAIGHGTKVGPHCLLVPQVGIAGSTTLGHHCVVGGQAGITGHIKIGNLVRIGAQSGVAHDVPDGKSLLGTPAIDASKGKRVFAIMQHLPDMKKRIKKIERQLEAIKQEKPDTDK